MPTPEKADSVPPPAPINLTATRTTSHTVDLAWGPWSGFEDTFAHEIQFMTSFGRRTCTVRYVDAAGNRSAESPPVTLDHGMRC